MTDMDDILWLGIGGLPHVNLAALAELARRWPRAGAALAHLVAGGDDLAGMIPPGRRATTTEAATRLQEPGMAGTMRADLAACDGYLVRAGTEPLASLLTAGAGWPCVLSVRGELPRSPCVSVVGMRKASSGGRHFARALGRDLAQAGLCVVSGLAFGIDRAAHEGALSAGGQTVAVLAGGVARPGPAANRDVAAAILATGGGLVSHVPASCGSPGWRFPIRNRLIAGLASVVVVVEAAARGGSLSTAAHALRLGCPVMAVPGPPWSEHSEGTNALLADGALVCRGVEDVLVALGLEHLAARPRAGRGDGSSPHPDLTEVEVAVLEAVPYTPESVDGVARFTSQPLVAVLAALGRLEQLGLVEAPTPTSVVRAQ
ncbi:MAG: DNA-protecting protein DprA [Acidimicrobiia bacterium]|nr:DNA-protecting protein DprA [Acidimicrobiia bacterium]